MRLNESVYLSSASWFTVAPGVNPTYQAENPLQVPAYYESSGTQYGGIYYGGQQDHIPLNKPIDDSICYAGVKASSPLNNWKYALLSAVPAEINVLQLGFTASSKNNVSFSHTADTITLDGTLNTSTNTILIFDLKTDASSSTEFPSNPFEGHPGTYTISPTGNSNIRLQLYGFNSGGSLQSIYNGSSGGSVTIDNSYDYYVFRLWIAGSSSFTNHTFTCKCTLQQQRSVNTFPACDPIDAGIFAAFSPAEGFYSTVGDGAAQRWCYYTDEATARTRGKCQYCSMPLTRYKYNDIVYCIYIMCSATINGSVSTFDLDRYFNTYRNSYPIIRAFYMRPYVGDPDSGTSRVYYNTSRKYEPTGGSQSSTIALQQNVPYSLPPGINLTGAAASVADEFYMYGFSATVERSGTLFGIPGVRNMESHAGATDFSGCTELYQCNMHRTTDLFQYIVDGYNVRTQYLGDRESILDLCAHFGVIFTDSQNSAERSSISQLTDPLIHVPIIQDGYITGDYLSGSEAADLDNASWTDDFRERNDYDGQPAEVFDMETELNSNARSAASPFTKRYICTIQTLIDLKAYLYQTLAPSLTAIEDSYKTFLTNNPIDCISSVVMFPFNIQDYIPSPPLTASIIIGNADTGISADYFYLSQILVIDGGSVEYRDKYKDFRSYEPYCDAELHIPYHGSVHITPSEFVGHQIGVKFLVDITSGASLALIYRDGLVIDSIAGQLGASIPITGVQTASYLNAVYNASAAYKQAKASQFTQTASALLGGLAAGISGNPLGAVMSVASGALRGEQSDLSIEQAKYNLDHVQVPYKTIGTNTPMTSIGNEQYCRLIIKRPIMQTAYKADLYAHTTGFACCITAKLGSVSGYTVIAAADLSGLQISAAEKQQLLRLLQSGIFM